MRSVLSCSGAFRLIKNNVPAARVYRSLTSPQLAVTTTVFTRPRYFASGPEGHIRDTDSAFSKKEKAVEDQWIRAQDAEKIKNLREELDKQKKKLKELEENLEELDNNKKKD